MNTQNNHDQNVCQHCYGHKDIEAHIKKQGKLGNCSYDDSHNNEDTKIIALREILPFISKLVQNEFAPGETLLIPYGEDDRMENSQYGELLDEQIAPFLGCEPNVLEDTCQLLYATYPDIFDEMQLYESYVDQVKRDKEAAYAYWYENRISFQWEEFCSQVIWEKRYTIAEKLLLEMFGDAKGYLDERICPFRNLSKGTSIFRARKHHSQREYEQFIKDPLLNLGPPNSEIATAGRMNAQHIPVFYGSFTPNVAVMEVQPGIGERVAVGEFKLTRNIKIFDFSSLKPDVPISVEDDTRYKVLSHLQNAMSKPIGHSLKSREYIPTQITTEFIKSHFEVDGIIFFSSLISDRVTNSEDNLNIVIFDDYRKGALKEGIVSIEPKDVSLYHVTDIKFDIRQIAKNWDIKF